MKQFLTLLKMVVLGWFSPSCEGGAAGALRPCADGSIGGGGMLNVDEDAVAGPRKRKIRVIQTILCYRHFWLALRNQTEKKAKLLRDDQRVRELSVITRCKLYEIIYF